MAISFQESIIHEDIFKLKKRTMILSSQIKLNPKHRDIEKWIKEIEQNNMKLLALKSVMGK